MNSDTRPNTTGPFDPGDSNAVRRGYQELEQRSLESVEALRQWTLDWSEFSALVDEEGSRRFIDSTCHTDDASIAARYREFLEVHSPLMKQHSHRLAKKLIEHPLVGELDPDEYSCFLRSLRNSVDLFRPENVVLQTQEAQLEADYDEIMGAMTVEFGGEELPLPRLQRFLEDPDRTIRERAFRGLWERVLRDADALEGVLESQMALRQQMAERAGLDGYRTYRFRQLDRFDYGPQDCERFAEAIEQVAVPAQKRRLERRRRALALGTLRPWDLGVDPHGRGPLRPFEVGDDLARGCEEIFRRVDPQFGRQFHDLCDGKLLDLESRKGKAPGGYQVTLQARRKPFIFMNASGVHADVTTLLHEGGHAFHSLECADEPLMANRDAPIEFAEVASMSMELLGAPHLDVFYPREEDVRRARLEHLDSIVATFPWVATIDSFQHWLYTHPGHSRESRRSKWLELMERFGGDVDWTGLEDIRSHRWLRQGHLFRAPFYYIEYAMAQLGALQVWVRSRSAPQPAVSRYRSGLRLGNRRTLPQLFEAVGATFDFSVAMLEDLLGHVEREIEALERS